MSIIKKIVEIADRSNTIDARKQIIKLNKEIKSYKEKVQTLIDANYIDFLPEIISNESLLEEGDILESDVQNLKDNLNNEDLSMLKASDEISRLVDDLAEYQASLKISLKLVKIDSLMQKIKLYNESQNYKEINNLLNSIQLLIGDPEDKIIRRLELYENLRIRLIYERENMMKNLDKQLNSLIQMKQRSFPKTRSITIVISKNTKEITECINSLMECDYNFELMIKFLVANVFEPIACRAVSMDIKENDKENTMILSYSTEKIVDELRPNYEIVFINIRSVLFFLLKMNVVISNGSHFLESTFKSERERIFDLIFNECLVHNIPKTYEEKNQSTIFADIEKMSKNFSQLHFFEASIIEVNLDDYSKKIESLFFQQFIKNVQASASEISKKDLHDMILISDDSTLSTTTPLTFQKAMISKSTLEIIKLLEQILRQATSCGKDEGQKKQNLLESIKAVLENYSFTIQLHHSQLLSKIPQQSALFYNNCIYLCNWITLCTDLNGCNMEVVIYELKRQAEEFFECQIAKQKIQLLEILHDFDIPQGVNNDIKEEYFKPISQCLRQMELLKNVWQTILPSDLYSKTMGDLLNVLTSDIIKKVTIMEDISTTLSNRLVLLVKTVDEKGQSLFAEDCSALDVVTSWQKLLHLQFILDASLVEIQASWKENQISKSFKAEEVKRLIRALFQNTERRAHCIQAII